MKKLLSVLLCALLLLCSAAQAGVVTVLDRDAEPQFDENSSLFRAYFFKTRASDCILLMCGGKTMLVDCADTNYGSQIIYPELQKLGVTRIDYAVNTHPHNDHINGFISLFDCIEVGQFFTCFPLDYCQEQIDCIAACRAHGIEVVEFDNDADLSFGGLDIWVWRDHKYDTPWPIACNPCSLIMHVSYGDCSLILTADCTIESFIDLYAEKGDLIASDIIKMPHHGHNRPSHDAFKAIHPQVAVITNNYSERIHPVHQFLCNYRCFAMYTGSGLIQAATDGETWQVTQYLIW